MAQLNGDGLYIKYGTERATPKVAGEYRFDGPLHVVEAKITLTGLGTARAILDDTVWIPAGVRIEEVEVVDQTASTGATAVLNVGLVRTDRTTTYDDDGFVAALALASVDAAGEKTTLNVGSTSAGAFIGTTLAYSGLLVADYDTAAFTAGVVYVRIYYYKP